MLWPDADILVSRRNLRQALSSLRHALEPAPMPTGSVVRSIHDSVQLNTDTVTSDVAEFESLVEQSRRADEPERALALLSDAVQLYKGDLLPGFNDDWIWPERLRLEDLYLSALSRLSDGEDADEAIAHLRIGIIREPFNEEWHQKLIKRYLEVGWPDKALDQFAELELALSESFGQRPSEESRRLAERAHRDLKGQNRPIHRDFSSAVRSKPDEIKVVLPHFANRYFGRDTEIKTICKALEESGSRLVTILGPAGVGKTRLSVQCATGIAERMPWNIWFVPLADRFKSSEIFEAIIAAMAPQNGGVEAEVARIAELTEGRMTLLVLDNLEQIAEDVGEYVAQLLDQAPNIVCLASSRQALQISAEQVIAIEPLPLPTEGQTKIPELAAIPSIQLFIDRCQTIRPDLQFNERNSSAIVTLCSRLDGLPLAIEIAAGLSNSFSPAQMVDHMPVKQTGLTSRRRDVPARHKSLRAAIDWSFYLLTPDLQTLFRQLCVFRGGFTLESVSEVCHFTTTGCKANLEATLEALQGLQERSLVMSQPSESGQAPRFSMLTAFREYAEDLHTDEELIAIRELHAEYFVRQAAPDRPFTSIDEQTSRHLAIELDYENYISALEFSLAGGLLERCVRLLGILSTRWLTRGPKVAERKIIRQIAEERGLCRLDAALRVQLQRMLGTTFIRSGEYEAAYEACQRATKIAQDEGDRLLLATCYSGLAVCAGFLGRLDECLGLNERVLALVGSDDLSLAERSYLGIGSVHWNFRRFAEASAMFDKARAVSVKLRGGEPDAMIVSNQARVALDLGRAGESLRLAHEAIRISRRLHDDFSLAVALTVVSHYHLYQKNLEAAVATNLEALEKCRQGDFPFFVLQCLRNQALFWIEMDRFEAATTLLAATSEMDNSQRSMDVEDEQETIARIKRNLTPLKFENAWAKGLAMDRVEAIRFVYRATLD